MPSLCPRCGVYTELFHSCPASPAASSAPPPPDPQGHCERSRLATCSLPVSSAEVCFVAGTLRTEADLSDRPREAAAFRYCMNVLLRHAASMTERQPEENGRSQTREASPL